MKKTFPFLVFILFILFINLLLCSCKGRSTSTATATPTLTATWTLTATITNTSTRTPTATRTPTSTTTATVTASPTPTPTNTATFTPTRTASPTRTATLSPTVTVTLGPDWLWFQNADIRLAYPQKWRVEDRSYDEKCIPDLVDCILRIVSPTDRDTFITLIGTNFSFIGKDIDLDEFDEILWILESVSFSSLGLEDEVKLIVRTKLMVGREPAIKRVFSEPNLQNNRVNGTLYVVRLLVISQRTIYHLYLKTTDELQFEAYQTLMDQIIGSIQFQP